MFNKNNNKPYKDKMKQTYKECIINHPCLILPLFTEITASKRRRILFTNFWRESICLNDTIYHKNTKNDYEVLIDFVDG